MSKLYQIAVFDEIKAEASTIEEAVRIYNQFNRDGAEVRILKLVTWRTVVTDVTDAAPEDTQQ